MPPTLICTVRDCRQPLVRDERRLVCPRNHSFDIARSGYANLLQPQDRRSKNPGDSAEAVAARRRFLDAGHGAMFLGPMIEMLRTGPATSLLDVGCGEGYHTDALRAALNVEAHGTDISTPAIDLAAKRHRHCSFVIANADRFLPWTDGSFSIVTSITARLNAGEFRRVLAPGGALLVAVAGPDDLLELREAVLGERKLIDRVDRTTGLFSGRFRQERHERVRVVQTLDPSAIRDVMMSSYRGLRRSERERLDALETMNVTLARDLLLFRAE